MPLADESVLGAEVPQGAVCVHCVSEDGRVKSCVEVFEGGVMFFIGAVPNMERDLAEKLTRKNMKSLPYWQENGDECLDGEIATEEEFVDALNKLHG